MRIDGHERCLTCGRTDAEHRSTDWTCVDPWRADAFLRKPAPRRPQAMTDTERDAEALLRRFAAGITDPRTMEFRLDQRERLAIVAALRVVQEMERSGSADPR